MVKRIKEKKQDLFREVCYQLEINDIDDIWFSTGSQVTAEGFKAVLYKIAEKTGIPPKHLNNADQLAWRLLHKSHEAMLQALQIINNPTLIYRLESFLILFINSWELLLKAKILKDTKKIGSVQFSENKSITFDKALNILFTSESDPIKENLVVIEELRNEATHMVVPIIPSVAIMIFQAGIFNYNKLLGEWFDRKIDEKSAGAMMFLISSLDPNSISIDNALLSKRITKEVALVLKQWENKVASKISTLGERTLNEFVIPIDVNISSVKNPNKAHILAKIINDDNASDVVMAFKYQRPIDKYPLSSKKLLEVVKRKKPNVKQNRIYDLIKELKIKENPDYSIPNFSTKQAEDVFNRTGKLPTNTTFIYNEKAIELIVSNL